MTPPITATRSHKFYAWMGRVADKYPRTSRAAKLGLTPILSAVPGGALDRIVTLRNDGDLDHTLGTLLFTLPPSIVIFLALAWMCLFLPIQAARDSGADKQELGTLRHAHAIIKNELALIRERAGALVSIIRNAGGKIADEVRSAMNPSLIPMMCDVILEDLEPIDFQQRFTQVEFLGKGGFGITLKAYDTVEERWICLKIMHGELAEIPEVLVRFIDREAKSLSRLKNENHPNIVDFYSVGKTTAEIIIPGYTIPAEAPILMMELVDGDTFENHMRGKVKEGRIIAFSDHQVVNYLQQMVSPMVLIHHLGIAHRDLKPENFMITPEDLLVLLDFGIAGMETESNMTRTGAIFGTVRYMSPEQAGAGKPGTEADIHALGIMLYELLARQHPINTINTMTGEAYLTLLRRGEIPAAIRANATINSELRELAAEMTAVDPTARPSATEVAKHFAELSGNGSGAFAAAMAPGDSGGTKLGGYGVKS